MPQTKKITKKDEALLNDIMQYAWQKGVTITVFEYKNKIYDVIDDNYFTKDVRQN